MASHDDYKFLLNETAYKLLSEHNVKQSTMFKWITDYLKEKVSSMPKVGVLYNNMYGGFRYSRAFKEFLLANNETVPNIYGDDGKDIRIRHVHSIASFGKHILETEMFKDLTEILCIHDAWNMKKVFEKLDRRRYKSKTVQTIRANYDKLKEYLKSPNSTYLSEDFENQGDSESQSDFCYYTPDAHILTYSHDFSQYKKSDLLLISTDEILNEVTKEIQEIDTYVLDDIKNEAIVEQIYDFFDKFHSDPKNVDSFKSENDLSFVESITKYGIDDVCSWRSKQMKFDSIAILFLLNKKNNTDGLNYFGTVSDTDTIDSVFKFGLVCASGTYCNLDVAYVPALIDWEVGEYDGLENVYVV